MSYPDQQSSDSFAEGRWKRSPAEWITFGLASFILTTVVGLVVYVWIAEHHQQPPSLSVVRNQSIRETAGQFYVPFEVTNSGGETVESVQIIAELRINGEVEEAGEQHIDFLSAKETEEGAFIFSRNPDEGELVIRVASYTLP
ncbi:TIGR02588 family protein [Oculatella sp. LEGE 06141]|uniref:TIGR02588 family protein n=1 Tax=Oculatella sp. LEGE 06141 TaxID=1828648 RepID=UPI00187FDB88|nr:TIGR02588 family protein [Oculatella sp. LEGE 06141]MBE9181243.1 TIGR02588 family protein [Oculatella sp. LEGE 06141]